MANITRYVDSGQIYIANNCSFLNMWALAEKKELKKPFTGSKSSRYKVNQPMNFYANADHQLSVLGDQPYPAFELRNIIRYFDAHQPSFTLDLLDHIQVKREDLLADTIPAFKVLAALKFCGLHFGPIAGARIGATYQVSDLGVFGYAIASARNLGHAFEIESKYYSLLGNLLKRSNAFEDHYMYATMYNVQNIDNESLSFFVALSNSSHIHIARSIFGDDIHFKSIEFSFDDDINREEYERIYGCNVTFNSEQNSWSLDTRLFERERKNSNLSDSSRYIPYCNELMSQLKQKDSLVNEIQQILVSCAGDYPDIEMLANAFNVSSRTLRRQLANIGTSYQKILNKVRCHLSIEYLIRTDIAVEDISNLIGFSDVTNFRHAFKKWVNKTPSAYRKIYQKHASFK